MARVRRLAEFLGWAVWFTLNSRGTAPGEFDLRMYRGPRAIVAELKTEVGQLSPAQRRAKVIYERVPGLEVYVWRPSDWDAICRVLT